MIYMKDPFLCYNDTKQIQTSYMYYIILEKFRVYIAKTSQMLSYR
jgi:hypothetical protein